MVAKEIAVHYDGACGASGCWLSQGPLALQKRRGADGKTYFKSSGASSTARNCCRQVPSPSEEEEEEEEEEEPICDQRRQDPPLKKKKLVGLFCSSEICPLPKLPPVASGRARRPPISSKFLLPPHYCSLFFGRHCRVADDKKRASSSQENGDTGFFSLPPECNGQWVFLGRGRRCCHAQTRMYTTVHFQEAQFRSLPNCFPPG